MRWLLIVAMVVLVGCDSSRDVTSHEDIVRDSWESAPVLNLGFDSKEGLISNLNAYDYYCKLPDTGNFYVLRYINSPVKEWFGTGGGPYQSEYWAEIELDWETHKCLYDGRTWREVSLGIPSKSIRAMNKAKIGKVLGRFSHIKLGEEIIDLSKLKHLHGPTITGGTFSTSKPKQEIGEKPD